MNSGSVNATHDVLVTAIDLTRACCASDNYLPWLSHHSDALDGSAPTAENFFGKVSKARITKALTEAGKPPTGDTAKLKKADLAAFAEKEIEGAGWLPEPVRICAVENEEGAQ